MALWNIKNVVIRGVAGVVPDNKVSTNQLSLFNAEEADIFVKTIGIENRYIAPDNVCASDLCLQAANNLLEELQWGRDSIDILVFESVTGDYRTPPTSAILQDRLGLSTATFSVDVPMGCCGCMYAINIAGNLLSNGNVKRALLLIGDTIVRMGSPYDKSRYPLFGDGATAIALEYDESAEDIVIDMHTMGSSYQALITPHSGFRHPVTPDSFIYEDFGNGVIRSPKDTLIKGMNVLAFAISKPPISVLDVMKQYNLNNDDVDYFLIHQANKMIVDRIVKKLKLNPEKVPYNLEEFGNLGGASIPMLMVSRIKEDLRTKPMTLLCSSFGLGLTWGTMILHTTPMVVCDLDFYNSNNL